MLEALNAPESAVVSRSLSLTRAVSVLWRGGGRKDSTRLKRFKSIIGLKVRMKLSGDNKFNGIGDKRESGNRVVIIKVDWV